MNIAQGVSGIEESKTLKLLKVKQDSLWSWVDNPTKGSDLQFTRASNTPVTKTWPIIAAALGVAELGEILKGHRLPSWDGKAWVWIIPLNDRNAYGHSDTEANARAQLVAQLIELKRLVP